MITCQLCNGSGANKSGLVMRVNNNLCPRCGGYGTLSTGGTLNSRSVNFMDLDYARSNGLVEEGPAA